jgi:hypothetical protein
MFIIYQTDEGEFREKGRKINYLRLIEVVSLSQQFNQALFKIPKWLCKRDMIDMGVHNTFNAGIQAINISLALLAHSLY